MDRSTLLSCGAAGGLVVLALCDSVVVAGLLATLLACAWWWGASGDKGDKKVSKGMVGDLAPLRPSSTAAGPSGPGVTSAHSSLLGEIQAFPEAASLTPVKSLEPQSGASLLVQEMVVQDIATFDRGELRQTETQEPLSGPDLAKKEMESKSLNAEVTSFDKAMLKETEVEERNVLPDQSDIKAEREKVELIGGIENFDLDNLARVSVKEPLSGAELVRQELGHQAVQLEIGAFDQTGLKVTEVKDSGWLPDQKDISEEKEKVDHLANIETFDTEGLHKVKTLEPLSGIELLKREITLKAVTEELGSFDVGTMRTTEVEEKNVLPDTAVLAEEKTRESLLAGVEQFPHDSLVHVKAPEPVTGAELLQQELTIKSIAAFDSSVLRAATTSERTVLPDAETLASERDRAGLLSALQEPHDLTPVTPKEPLGGAELVRQELTRQQVLESVATFDPEGLKHSEVQERAVLPDLSNIEQERSHVQHLAGIGTFDQSVLAPVKVPEPLSGPEVARQESLREGISTELASFDKGELRETEVEEKGVLPGSEDIQAERRHMEHMQGLESGLQLRSTQTREPSSPLDLAKLELNKDQMEEELQAFNRARLTPVVTEEKVFLPSAEELRAAELEQALEVSPVGAAGLRDMLKEEDGREHRSSSEEWEKVDGDSEC